MKEAMRCEFCAEFGGAGSLFEAIYGSVLSSRVVLEEDGFAVMPSIGQVFPGSLMVLPRAHIERFADLPLEDQVAAQRLIDRLRRTSTRRLIAFEHGAREATGGGCGIYHAHIHVVPVPDHMDTSPLVVGLAPSLSSLKGALCVLAASDEYLLLFDSEGRGWSRVLSPADRSEFPSQYFRRCLAALAGTPGSWDWRTIEHPERRLVEAVAAWRSQLSEASAPLAPR